MSDFGWAFVKHGILTASAPPVKSVQFNDGNEQLGGSADFTFDKASKVLNLTGTLNVSGAINANQYNVDVVNKTVTNISADGSSKFGDTTNDTHVFTGSIDLSSSTNPIKIHGLQSGAGIDSNSYLALNSSFQLVLTSAAGASSGGTIGAAEDGNYADGLYSDFTTSTTVGTAIDRFNEILKIIVPGPAPAVDRINYTNTNGQGLNLSVNAGSKPSDYTAVANTGSFNDNLTINSQYPVATSGEDFRLGVYNGTQEITGVINFDVTEQLKGAQINYSNNAFGNAESGSLKLFVNGTLKHTLNLTASGAGNPNSGSNSQLNSNGSGFFDLSVTASAKDQNGSVYDIFQHRTSKYVVDPQDQRKGWNIAKVEHEFGAVTYVTNFVQWFNDTDANSNAMSVDSPTITVAGSGAKYLSGVKYFTAANVTYSSSVANVYKHTYPTGNVLSFTQTNLNPASATSLPAIGGSESFSKLLQISQASTNSTSTMLGTTFSRGISLTHPLKTDLSNAGSATSNPTLIYNVSNDSDNLNEKFDDESFRITSGSYTTQGSVTAGAASWNSQNHMTGSGASGHTDGLMFFNSNLYSPKNTPVAGITNGNFSALADGPTGNPNYSTQTGTRTFYRKIQNTSGATKRDLKITSDKSTKINNSSLSTDNIQFFAKIPGSTGWMDISQNFVYGSVADGNGALIDGASDNSNTGGTATADSVHCVTFGTASIANNEYVVIKILADHSWTSFVENLTFQLGATANTATAAPDQDNINNNQTTGVEAKISFGPSNPISGYENVQGSSLSLSNLDSNGVFNDNTNTRGVFSSFANKTGNLNNDVSANGNNYPARAFGNAFTGSLKIFVNNTSSAKHTVDLSSTTNAITSYNGNNSGFVLSSVGFSTTTDNIPNYTLPYRTGTWQAGADDQRQGWNYVKVDHVIGGTTHSSQYIEWVVDNSASVDTTIDSTPTISNFGHTSIYYQSGIKYFAADPTGSFEFSGSNYYRNVYSSDSSAISFPTTTNASITNIRAVGTGLTTQDAGGATAGMPALNNSANCELTDISVTGTVEYDGPSTSISGGLGIFTHSDVTVSGRITHPIKTDRTTATQTKSAFMRYSGSLGSTTLANNEYFNTEDYRVVSGNYDNQAALTSSTNTWNPQTVMNSGGTHDDGLVSSNGYVISPFKIGNAGDTRNLVDGGSLQAPTGNPNYSTLTNNTRTYYRMFKYTGSSTVASFTLTLYGDATLVGKSGTYAGSLGASKNCFVELKVPFDPNFSGADDQSTDWADTAKIFESSAQPNVLGAGIRAGSFSGEDQSIDSNGLPLSLTLGTRRIKQNQHFVVKISAHKDWTGYISRVQVAY